MKKIFLFASLALLSGLVLTACGSGDDITKNEEIQKPDDTTGGEAKPDDNQGQGQGNTSNGETRSINMTETQKTAVAKNNDFAFNMFRQVSTLDDMKGRSFVSSPLSATYALGMLNTGGQGKTSEEITAMLGFAGGSKQDVNDLCKLLIDEAPKVDEKAKLKLADCVVTNLDIKLSENYQKEITDYYQGEAFAKDFKLPATIDFINAWCKDHTEGMIKQIISELNPQARMVLMNAIYFKAPWSGKFSEKDTQNETFTKEDGSKQTLPMMNRKDATFYRANNLYATIGLPYGNGKNWVMYVLLPNEGHTVGEVLKGLTNDSWNKNRPVISQYAGEVDVKLPKFKVESEIWLNSVFESLGASTMFNPAQADFSPMTADGTPLWVSLIKQKAAIEVTEECTEASALTIATLDTEDANGGGVSETPRFYATRPFIYMIQEATSGAIFFIGTYQGN